LAGQKREILEIGEVSNLGRMEANSIEARSIVGNVLVGVDKQALQGGCLKREELVERKPLRLLKLTKVL
jgi:hypothetical protein